MTKIDIEGLLEAMRKNGVAPNLAAGVAWRAASGSWDSRLYGEVSTRFDLASVTKPLLAVALARSGMKDKTLGELLPLVEASKVASATIELLLSHRAGLVAHLPLWLALPFDRDAALLEAANARRDDAVGDGPHVPMYSDLGYLLAGEAASRSLGFVDAGELMEEYVVAPLELRDRLGTARSLNERARLEPVAPTEDAPFRGGIVRGAVHDENAWAFGGYGGCGHAGMFATVNAVLAFGRTFLDALDHLPNPLFKQKDNVDWLVAPRRDGTLRAGFDGKSESGSSAGTRFGAQSIGHLGFTGTSLWIDPDAKVVAVFLSNRVCPTRENTKIRQARPQMHDALFDQATRLRAELSAPAGSPIRRRR